MSLDLQSKVKEHIQLEDTTTSTEADNQISTDDTSGYPIRYPRFILTLSY